MRSIIHYFLHSRLAANLLMFTILAMGAFGMFSLKTTFFPQVTLRFIAIQAVYPGASPEEMEEGVIQKIEENLKGVNGVERVTSVSSENAGSVQIEVEKGANIDNVLQDVKNAVDRINSFPVALEPPTIFKVEQIDFAINFALSGNVDLKSLKKFAYEVEDDLRAIEGISQVELSGFPEEEIEIAFREADLRRFQMTFQEATFAVQKANLDLTGGTVKGDKEELLIRARNKNYYSAGLRDIVVRTSNSGNIVRLHEVADIRDKWADNPNRSYLNDAPSVIVTVNTTIREDIIPVTDKVKEYLEKFNAENEVVKATLIRDQSVVLQDRIGLLTENGVMGFFIVLILLAMFLNWRLAFWVALSIPISFAGMFFFANLLGITINVISLFGMILVIGILVDDGIVISENIYQKYEGGMPRYKAALEGTMEVLPAVFAAITTTVIAFNLFYYIDGQIGDFFSSMATVVILCLIFSLVEGALVLPAHVAHSKAMAEGHQKNKVSKFLDDVMFWFRDKLYAPILRFSMNNKMMSFGIIMGALLVTGGALAGGIVKTTFFPFIEGDTVEINLKLPAGTSEKITDNFLQRIQEVSDDVNTDLKAEYLGDSVHPIINVERVVGPTTYEGRVVLTLLNAEERGDISTVMVTNKVRDQLGPLPEAETLTFGGFSPFGKPVEVSLVGDNYKELNAATVEVKNAMLKLAELKDVVDNNQEGLREINLSLKPKADYLGLSIQDIIGQVRQGYFGSEIQRLQRGRDEVRVWVRYDESYRNNIKQLENMRVRFAGGQEYRLGDVANLEVDRGVIAINHIDGKREVKIEADIANDKVSSSEINTSLESDIIPPILSKYPSVTANLDGQSREQQKAFRNMPTYGALTLFLMFIVIALTFSSISQTLVVFLLIPFGLIGVAWGHYLMDFQISMFSNLGTLALIGILVNDALVFISAYNNLLKTGMGQMDALYEAGLSRFRPIILTSITTVAGLTPLLFETSFQAQFLIPMAISVSFGLLFVTVIILVLLPILLIATNRAKYYFSYAWNGERSTYEAMEPAVKDANGRYGAIWMVLIIILLFVMVLSNVL